MSKGRVLPGVTIAEQPDRLVWVAMFQQFGAEDPVTMIQKLEDMDHETRCLIAGDLTAEKRREWMVQQGQDVIPGLQLVRIFQTTDGTFQKTLREVSGESLN